MGRHKIRAPSASSQDATSSSGSEYGDRPHKIRDGRSSGVTTEPTTRLRPRAARKKV